MTSAEALLINSGGALAAGWYGLTSFRHRRPTARDERRERIDESDRRFALSLGLDPDAVLGRRDRVHAVAE